MSTLHRIECLESEVRRLRQLARLAAKAAIAGDSQANTIGKFVLNELGEKFDDQGVIPCLGQGDTDGNGAGQV